MQDELGLKFGYPVACFATLQHGLDCHNPASLLAHFLHELGLTPLSFSRRGWFRPPSKGSPQLTSWYWSLLVLAIDIDHCSLILLSQSLTNLLDCYLQWCQNHCCSSMQSVQPLWEHSLWVPFHLVLASNSEDIKSTPGNDSSHARLSHSGHN